MNAPFTLVDCRGLSELARAERRGWLVDGLIPEGGVTLVAGHAFAGKTRLMVALSVAVAAGVPIAGRAPLRGPVLWVPAEHPIADFEAHLQAAATGMGVEPADLPIHAVAERRRWRLDDPEAVAWLKERADALDARLVVLDSFRRLTTLEETRSEDVATAMHAAADLASDYQRAVVVLHHPAKSGGLRGSTDFAASTESTLMLTKGRADVLTLRAEHHRGPEVVLHLRLAHDEAAGTMRVEPVDGDAVTPVSSARDRAIEHAIGTALGNIAPPGLSLTKLRQAVRDDLAKNGHRAENEAIVAVINDLVAHGTLVECPGPRNARMICWDT